MTKENYLVTNKLNDSKDLTSKTSSIDAAAAKSSAHAQAQRSLLQHQPSDDSVFVNDSSRLKAPALPASPSEFRNYQMKMRFYLSQDGVDETDLEDMEDSNRTMEDSPNGHWTKLDTEISVQKLFDFDSTYLGIDTEKGIEIAWNEMKYTKALAPTVMTSGRQAGSSPVVVNRFDSVESLECIYKKLKNVLDVLIKLDHPNILKFHDYWYTNSELEAKLVVITEYSSAGSLKKALDNSKMTQTKVKPQSYKRWLNQIVHPIRYLHKQKLSIFQGHLNSETIFIQNNGVIKLTPTLLLLSNISDVSNNLIRAAPSTSTTGNSSAAQIRLTTEIAIKDIRAVGLIAVEIFCAHMKSAPSSPSSQNRPVLGIGAQRFITHSIEMICSMRSDDNNPLKYSIDSYDFKNDDAQKDFVFACFNVEKLKAPKTARFSPPLSGVGVVGSPSSLSSSSLIETIWFHPLINDIYNLRVLSVYSILKHFQETKVNKSKGGKPPGAQVAVPTPKSTLVDLNRSNKANSDQSIPELDAARHLNILKTNLAGISNRRTTNNESFDYLDQVTEDGGASKLTTTNNSSSDSKLEKMNRVSSSTFSVSSSKQARFNQTYQITADQRKESLSLLTNDPHFQTLPRNFYGILEDIRYGLYPRLFRLDCDSNSSCTQQSLRHISSNSCVDYLIQQINRRSSLNYLTGLNEKDLKKLQFINSHRKSLMNSSYDSTAYSSSSKNKKNSSDYHDDSYDDDEEEHTLNDDEEEEEDDEDHRMEEAGSFLSDFDPNTATCNFRAVENRRLVSEHCSVENNQADTKLIDLNLDLRFNDDLRRSLKCSFPIEFLVSNLHLSHNFVSSHSLHKKIHHICNELTIELIEYGLVNKHDHSLIAELFLRTVKDYLKKSISLTL